MTEPAVQITSGQSHGEDDEFHEERDDGLPSCCLTLRRRVRSLWFMDCE